MRRPGVRDGPKEFFPISADTVASDVRDLLIRAEMPPWSENAHGVHFLRGSSASSALAAGHSRELIRQRLRIVSAAVFDKHYARPVPVAVAERFRVLSRLQRGVSPSEAPLV